MVVHLVAFGIAKDIIGKRQRSVQLDNGATIADLKSHLVNKFPDFERLASLSFAVNETYQLETFQLSDECEIVIIPPVSGG